MQLSAILSVFAMILIIGVRYVMVSGVFAFATRVRLHGVRTGWSPQVRREISWSLLSCVIYGIPAGVVAWGWAQRGWTRIYTHLDLYPLWWWPLSLMLYLFAHDSWFYWTHRAMHTPGLFKGMHHVHHESRPPTAWAAMSFHPWEALTGAVVIPVLVFVVPIHLSALAAVLTIMTIMGVTNHMGWELFPRAIVHGSLGRWLITASHHHLHHERYRCNYGLYFRFWDRLCRTDAGIGAFGSGDGVGAIKRRG